MNARVADRSFGRCILQFSDADKQQLQVGLQFARKTVAQIANQARGPLKLASALIDRARTTFGDQELRETLDGELQRISENISKADLSYERLARALAGKDQFTLKMLFARAFFDLPDAMRQRLNIDGAAEASLRGDLAQLSLALKLWVRAIAEGLAKGSRLRVTSEIQSEYATITLRWLQNGAEAADKYQAAIASPRFDSAIGVSPRAEVPASLTDDLKVALASQGGTISAGEDSVRIQLPRASQIGEEIAP